MTTNLDTLTAPFPKEAIKWRWADKQQTRKLDYVEGHVYIHRINDATDNTWSMEVKDITSRDFGTGQLVMVRVAVTIPEHGTREGLGVQAVHERGGEDLIKGALTDAMKNALKYFGVGLELYGPDYEAGETTPAPRPERAPERPAAPATAPANARITEAQQRLVRALMQERGVDDELMHIMILADYDALHLRDLSKQEASAFIDVLRARPIAQVRGVKQEPQKGYQINQQGYDVPEEPQHLSSHFA